MIKDLLDRLPDDAAALQLLELFDKLLKKYARLLGTEDAYELPCRCGTGTNRDENGSRKIFRFHV